MENMRISLPRVGSEIVLGKSYKNFLVPELLQHSTHNEWIMVSDDNVFSLYGAEITAMIEPIGKFLGTVVFAAGEANKNLNTLSYIYEQLLAKGANRHTTIIALGGGVVGDMAGLAAATYMRGVDYVQIPTTLMAQIDSSIGGKTGVDLPQGKNLVGSFYHPKLIFIDPVFLRTLTASEYQNGLSELLKYALLTGESFLSYLEKEQGSIKAVDFSCLYPAIKQSIELKTRLVEQDDKDKGRRQTLNLGHTLAHALESVTGYDQYTHGQAVAIGLVWALRMSEKRLDLDNSWRHRVEKLLKYWELPTEFAGISVDEIVSAMQADKKNFSGKLNLVLLAEPGQCELIDDITETDIRTALDAMKAKV